LPSRRRSNAASRKERHRVTDLLLTLFRYGQMVVEKYRTFKGADIEINERVLRIETQWKRTSSQLSFVNQVWQTMDRDLQILHDQILQVLMSKLQIAHDHIEGI